MKTINEAMKNLQNIKRNKLNESKVKRLHESENRVEKPKENEFEVGLKGFSKDYFKGNIYDFRAKLGKSEYGKYIKTIPYNNINWDVVKVGLVGNKNKIVEFLEKYNIVNQEDLNEIKSGNVHNHYEYDYYDRYGGGYIIDSDDCYRVNRKSVESFIWGNNEDNNENTEDDSDEEEDIKNDELIACDKDNDTLKSLKTNLDNYEASGTGILDCPEYQELVKYAKNNKEVDKIYINYPDREYVVWTRVFGSDKDFDSLEEADEAEDEEGYDN